MLENQNLPSLSADSAVPGLNRNLAYMNRVLIPSKELTDSFQFFAEPVFEMIEANEHQSRTLAKLRDTLLPRLISGELRVPELNDDWHAFIERTAGSLSDDPIQRPPQGDYEERDALE